MKESYAKLAWIRAVKMLKEKGLVLNLTENIEAENRDPIKIQTGNCEEKKIRNLLKALLLLLS